MTLESHQPVGQIVAERMRRARVFDELEIDYCCHGQTPLGQACAERGLDVADVLARVNACDAEADDRTEPNVAAMELGQLADHIENTHHVYMRAELPQLEQLHAAVLAAHGARHPELRELGTLLAGLHAEIDSHLMKEERILFPMIRQLEAAATLPRFHCGSVANPIRRMLHEHDMVGSTIEQMRQLTQGFVAPSDGCASYRLLMERLAGLETDLHRHIHKENNVLFPRAAALEAERAARED
jgi:regulator of cell morphogenesis and NO signaling